MFMKEKLLFRGLLALAAGSLLLGGCVYRERVVYRQPVAGETETEVEVGEAPPAPIVEDISIAPAPGFIWIGGFWAWNGRWMWQGGRWAHPPRHGALWIGPRYVVRGGRHVFIRGYWR
jgi:hypothetical protein